MELITPLRYTDGAFAPKSLNQQEYLARIIEFQLREIIGKYDIELAKMLKYAIHVSSPKEDKTVMDGNIQSSVILNITSPNLDSFVRICERYPSIPTFFRNLDDAIHFKPNKAYVQEYDSGYDLTANPGYSGFSGALPMKESPGSNLKRVQDYVETLIETER